MTVQQRANYYRRIFAAYLTPGKSHLTFWYDEPRVNENFRPDELGEYYMPFSGKADYSGEYDHAGIPLLNYRGKIGLQYNPIAIAQYGLGNYNLYRRTGDAGRRRKFTAAADWLVSNLEQGPAGLRVWNHHFDFEYRDLLRAPWHSALAQGQGISLLVRAYADTENAEYLDTAGLAFQAFLNGVDSGGVTYVDDGGHTWFEEYIVSPPTHILNGFIWATWGVYDYLLATRESAAQKLFHNAVATIAANLPRYDAGFWSIYEQSGTRLSMLASPFYHRLHIVQLQIMHRLTGEDTFREFALTWDAYRRSFIKRSVALPYKALFKLLYY